MPGTARHARAAARAARRLGLPGWPPVEGASARRDPGARPRSRPPGKGRPPRGGRPTLRLASCGGGDGEATGPRRDPTYWGDGRGDGGGGGGRSGFDLAVQGPALPGGANGPEARADGRLRRVPAPVAHPFGRAQGRGDRGRLQAPGDRRADLTGGHPRQPPRLRPPDSGPHRGLVAPGHLWGERLPPPGREPLRPRRLRHRRPPRAPAAHRHRPLGSAVSPPQRGGRRRMEAGDHTVYLGEVAGAALARRRLRDGYLTLTRLRLNMAP